MRTRLAATVAMGMVLGAAAIGLGSGVARGPDDKEAVVKALDSLHELASKADEAKYFALFAPDGVFLGTDATERWTVDEFRAYAHPHFSQGHGCTYVARPGKRHVTVKGDAAWFDEVVDNEKYGECRGTGVLARIDGAWKIEQYNLTVPVPNDLMLKVVEMIKTQGPAPADGKKSGGGGGEGKK